jgi:hypothetical protein
MMAQSDEQTTAQERIRNIKEHLTGDSSMDLTDLGVLGLDTGCDDQ